MKRPHRRFELEIQISGDTWDDVVQDLRHVAAHVEQHGPACSSVMGGPSSGHIVGITERPEMTHERYHADLRAYLSLFETDRNSEVRSGGDAP